MKRFVEHFHNGYGLPSLVDQINSYAERHNVEIVMIAPRDGDGIYVLFEYEEDSDDRL